VTSITEVARRAGVSVSTASRVVSEADYPVSAEARERVLEAARELDYVPNALARGLLKRHLPVVAVIVHDITDPYFAEIVRGVEDAAAPAGFLVITCSSERDPARESEYVRLLRSMRAAAVIFAGSGLDDPALNAELPRHLGAMRSAGAAVVHLSPHALGEPEIRVDNAGGIASMVRALVDLGHRSIAFLAGPSTLYVARERLAGYSRGLAVAGIEPDPRLVIETTFDHAGGAAAVDRLLAGGAPITAVLAANDLLAIGAIRRLAERGIDVPGQVSVAGFDDIAIASVTAPALSTVRLPLREMGRLGFASAERQLAGEPDEPRVVPTEVVLRGSTAPPPAAAASRAAARGASPLRAQPRGAAS